MPDVAWIHYSRPRTAWYRLDESAQKEHRERFDAARAASRASGGRAHGTFFVRGQSDYSRVEIWTFPDADAAFGHWSRLVDAGYARWFESANSVGLRDEEADA
ncbi:MAG TPA: hypothetical protein VF053_03395 [Streptosporangiales bacterium]